MPVGDGGQALELELAVVAKLALDNASGSGTAQSLVRFIDLRLQLDIRSRIASGKTMAVTGFDPHPPRGQVTAHQARQLRPAQPVILPRSRRSSPGARRPCPMYSSWLNNRSTQP